MLAELTPGQEDNGTLQGGRRGRASPADPVPFCLIWGPATHKKANLIRDCSIIIATFVFVACQVKGVDGRGSVGCPLVPFHVQGDALADVLGRADGVDASLGLAEAAVAALDGVAGGRQQPVIQEGQGLFQVGREQFAERAADPLEAADAPPEAAQLGQGGLGPAPPVEQTVHFIHDLAERSQVRQAASNLLERSFSGRRQVMLNEQVAMVEQVGNSLLDSLGLAGLGLIGPGRTASRKGRLLGLEFLAGLGHRVQHRLGDFFEDVELADLMVLRQLRWG